MTLPHTMDRWIEGLGAGLYAQALAAIPLESADPAATASAKALSTTLADKLMALGIDDDTNLLCLPISTLRALSHPYVYPRLLSVVGDKGRLQSVIEKLTSSPGPGLPPPLSAAAVLAHLCLSGFGGASSIVRCGSALVGNGWDIPLSDVWREKADLHLTRLRNRDPMYPVDNLGRIEELEAFHQAIPGADIRWHWELVENAIFHQLHDWPFVVDSGSVRPGDDTVRFNVTGIPVLVDLAFDDKSEVYPHFDQPDDSGALAAMDWHSEIRKALQAAKHLWRSQHGSALPAFQDSVLSASVHVDFRVAEAMLAAGPVDLNVMDRSMGPTFVQAILHRLVGRTVSLDCAITGTIGERLRDREHRELLNYYFEPAGAVERKLVHMFRSQQFSKGVLSDAEPEATRKRANQLAKETGGRMEVNYCYRLSDVADAVQFGAWRRKRYINCPDVRRLMHAAPEELLDYSSAEVEQVRGLLADSTKTVVRIPRDISPLAVMSYLYHVNKTERERFDRRPPALTWIIARAVEDQGDLRFWARVWDQVGASQADFYRFRHASNQRAAASELAGALNSYSPRASCLSHAAPDLLVVMADTRVAPDDWKIDAASYRTFLFPALVEELSKRLEPTGNTRLRPFLGKTRIILLGHGEVDVGRRPSKQARVSKQDWYILSRLNVFRFGFTQQMSAAALEDLKLEGLFLREVLGRLTEGDHLYRMGDEYWHAGKIGVDDGMTRLPQEEQARRHWGAARALAPYLSSSAELGVVPERSFQLDAIHEAAFHLEMGGRSANIAVQDASRALRETGKKWNPALGRLQTLRKSIREAHGRLLAFLEVPSVGVVTWLSRDRAGLPPTAAWDIAKDQFRESEALGVIYTAQQRAAYAHAGTELLDDRRNTKGLDIDRAQIGKEVFDQFETAMRDAAHEPRGNIRLAALTHYGLFLWKIDLGLPDRAERLIRVRQQVGILIGNGIRSGAVQSRWFEIEGDQHEHPEDAAAQYEIGIQMSPVYGANCIKLAGTTSDPAIVQVIVKNLRERKLLEETVRWAKAQEMPIRSGLDVPWMGARWTRGVENLIAASSV